MYRHRHILVELGIHVFELRCKVLFQLWSLGLECGSEKAVFDGKWIRMQINVFHLQELGIKTL